MTVKTLGAHAENESDAGGGLLVAARDHASAAIGGPLPNHVSLSATWIEGSVMLLLAAVLNGARWQVDADPHRRLNMKSAFGIAVAAMSCLCVLSAAAAAPPGSSVDAAPGSAPGVLVSRRAELEIVPGSEKYFSGRVQIAGQFQREHPSRVTGAIVSFTPGAHTAWHSHPAGQTLIVTEGIGLVQNWGGSVQEIRAGDVIWIPPGVKHWHGATGSDAMTHIAIQEKVNAPTSSGWSTSPSSSSRMRMKNESRNEIRHRSFNW